MEAHMTQSRTRPFLALIFALALALGGALMLVPANGASATEHECGEAQHPSGNDRCEEPGGSGDQGNAQSDPDDDGRGPDRSNGGVDQDGGTGGENQQDQDANNGCGNDQDFEDDNEGLCGGGERSGDNANGGNRPATTDDDDDDRGNNAGGNTPTTSDDDDDDRGNNAGGNTPTTSDDDDDDDAQIAGGEDTTTPDDTDSADDDEQRPATPQAPGRDSAPGQQHSDDHREDGEADAGMGTNSEAVAADELPADDVGVSFGSQVQAQTPTVDDESAVTTAAVPAEADGSAEVVEQAEGELPATGANVAGGLLTAFGFYGLGALALRRGGRPDQEEPWLRA
jgi:hypothetical protein